MQFRERFKIETTTIFSMLDLENLRPQKKLGLLAVNKKSTDPLDALEIVSTVSAKAKFILALYFYLAVEEHYDRPSTVTNLSRLGISAV